MNSPSQFSSVRTCALVAWLPLALLLVPACAQSNRIGSASEPELVAAEARLLNNTAAARPETRAASSSKLDALMIGDSLSVGGFGEAMEPFLWKKYRGRVALFASCGSSPQHWLRDEPTYFTHCGYRELSPERGRVLRDFENGHPPAPTPTPKLESLLEKYQPTTLIVQQGTNWMDEVESRGMAVERPRLSGIMDRFATAVARTKSVRRVIWITPPDSSRFSSAVEKGVDEIIRNAAKQHGFEIVDSSAMTRYTAGTGGDGVHYKNEPAYAWAAQVQKDRRFAKP